MMIAVLASASRSGRGAGAYRHSPPPHPIRGWLFANCRIRFVNFAALVKECAPRMRNPAPKCSNCVRTCRPLVHCWSDPPAEQRAGPNGCELLPPPDNLRRRLQL